MSLLPEKVLDSKVSVFGYLCLCLNVLFFSAIFVADPLTSQALTREDNWVENLTVVWFLLAGLLLLVTALVERSFFRCCVYILGAMAMVFAAGEEISWGQRIFGFATPDFLMHLNDQKEFTVHNIVNKSFDMIYMNGTMILCMATSAAFFCRKDRLFGIPLPSILLMLGFLIVISYESGENLRELSGESFREYLTGVKRSFGFILVEEKGLLLLFLIFTLLSRQLELTIASAATLALVLALTYVNYHGNIDVGSLYEVREYLFGMGVLFYSLELLLAQERLAAISRTSFSGLKRPVGRIPFWLMTCSVVVAGSIGLMLLEHFNVRAKAAAIEEAYESITAGEPVDRSSFDVWLIENELTYVKSPCGALDTQARFFLHIVPEAVEDLPAHRRRWGFDNLDFHYDDYGSMLLPDLGGRCMVQRRLPDYPIARMSTGQHTSSGGQIWKAEIPVRAISGETGARSAPGRAPSR